LLDGSAAAVCRVITDKTNAADLSSGVFAFLISVTLMKKLLNPLPFHKFQKLPNSDVTKDAPNHVAFLQRC